MAEMMTEEGKLRENLCWAIGLPVGWQPLYESLIRKIFAVDPLARVVDAKEKFGEMRVYMAEYNEAVFALVDVANAKSRTICQMCGDRAVLSRTADGFFATVCSNHADGYLPATSSPLRHVRMVVPKSDLWDPDRDDW